MSSVMHKAVAKRLGALGYKEENPQERDGIRDSTWRRVVGTQKVTVARPVMIEHKGKMLRAYEDEEVERPVTRSLYVVESKDGVEIYNGGVRYTLDEIEEEERAEAAGHPLPQKQSIIVTDS